MPFTTIEIADNELADEVADDGHCQPHYEHVHIASEDPTAGREGGRNVGSQIREKFPIRNSMWRSC